MAEEINGVILIDKPQGMTSHDVVDRLRRIARTRRVGHTGTLDPMATGLLIVCIGGATRISPFLTGLSKEYTGVIKLGAVSSTYDAEGSIMAQTQPLPRDEEMIRSAMRGQMGIRFQLPPPYSAVKIRGKKLYEYARRGEEVPQKPRQVRIDQFEMLDYCEPEIRFRARVGSGTYIRSMAHDLGIELGCGAFLASLRRERAGQLHVNQAVKLGELVERPELLEERLLDLSEALGHLPKVTVGAKGERDVLHGRSFGVGDIIASETLPRVGDETVVLNEAGKVLSISRAEMEAEGDEQTGVQKRAAGMIYFKPVRVLAVESP
ncbi:tRNA pseudouridine(55) synthase TruB [Candidatus Sumerlaeota bacterium]|nr:tRNA pseudouridine(55) synthase TruB [Candidatus Sumerlaeota bacterium]